MHYRETKYGNVKNDDGDIDDHDDDDDNNDDGNGGGRSGGCSTCCGDSDVLIITFCLLAL